MTFRTLTLAVLASAFAVAAFAQQPGLPSGQARQRNTPNGQTDPRKPPQPKIASATEQMLEWMRRQRENDPAKTVIPMLMKRNDVRGELGLDPQQREAIQAAEKKQGSENKAKLEGNEFFLELQKKLQEIGQLPPDQQEAARRTAMEELKERGQKLADSLKDQAPKNAADYEKLLRPNQMERLRQLDVQWRGPLALSDPNLREVFQLGDEQVQMIGQLVNEYREQQREIINKALGEDSKAANPNGNGEGITVIGGDDAAGNNETVTLKDGQKGQRVSPKSDTEIQNRYDVARRQVDALRKKYGELALKVLAPEQRQYWFQVQGRQFTFRAND